jgi:WD40 repeat protein
LYCSTHPPVQELSGELGAYLAKNAVSVEQSLRVVYMPQAVFRVRPVARCTASMAGHAESVLVTQFSPDGRRLATGSGDTTLRFWDLNTQLPQHECKVRQGGSRPHHYLVSQYPDCPAAAVLNTREYQRRAYLHF